MLISTVHGDHVDVRGKTSKEKEEILKEMASGNGTKLMIKETRPGGAVYLLGSLTGFEDCGFDTLYWIDRTCGSLEWVVEISEVSVYE